MDKFMPEFKRIRHMPLDSLYNLLREHQRFWVPFVANDIISDKQESKSTNKWIDEKFFKTDISQHCRHKGLFLFRKAISNDGLCTLRNRCFTQYPAILGARTNMSSCIKKNNQLPKLRWVTLGHH
ncbi:hypothetical protein GJ496_009988 [Pomphorhynchus laevis]|nr:hypothetical protein GJ496_009988 [Pomphorhynchus laevis]